MCKRVQGVLRKLKWIPEESKGVLVLCSLRRCNMAARRAKGNQVKSMVFHGGVRGLTVVKVVQEVLRVDSSIC